MILGNAWITVTNKTLILGEKLWFCSAILIGFLNIQLKNHFKANFSTFNPNPLRCFSFDFCIKVFSAPNGPIFKIFFLPERF